MWFLVLSENCEEKTWSDTTHFIKINTKTYYHYHLLILLTKHTNTLLLSYYYTTLFKFYYAVRIEFFKGQDDKDFSLSF